MGGDNKGASPAVASVTRAGGKTRGRPPGVGPSSPARPVRGSAETGGRAEPLWKTVPAGGGSPRRLGFRA